MINHEGHLTSAKGFKAATAYVGIKEGRRQDDVALLYAEAPCAAAGVFTRNKVKAAPVLLSQKHIQDGKAQAIIANSGNANCCTPTAADVAEALTRQVGHALAIAADDVLIASTGVIGAPLPLSPIVAALPSLVERLHADGGKDTARAIMTSDTKEKHASITLDLGDATVTIGAVAKGSGMIHPNMGTMLCFATTDAAIESSLLQELLTTAVDESFNMVSVDGDTSTNDTVFLLASGAVDHAPIEKDSEGCHAFSRALTELFIHLAKAIAGDGEGASRLMICHVNGAKTKRDARQMAKSIVVSPLVKAALHGADANWGRILCAAGYSGADFDIDKVHIGLSSAAGHLMVCENGSGLDFDEALATAVMKEERVTIEVVLADGEASAEAYGCDLTCDYVHINSDYRS